LAFGKEAILITYQYHRFEINIGGS
jgi:hypothetical protein